MKKKIALVAGGYSGEFVVSINSAKTIEANLNASVYDVYKIIITKASWYYELQDGARIEVNKNDFSLTLNGEKIIFDFAFIVLHGTPGEDGKLQGYFDMLDIPYNTCNSIVSALTFNKSFCNKVVRALNIVHIAQSVHLFKSKPFSLGAILEQVSLPVFVKPNESGSSLGVSKVMSAEALLPAIEKAFTEDNEVLVEEYIQGRELTIGVYALDGEVKMLPPTEIISKNEFFDFEAKYSGASDEITPAQISETILNALNKKAAAIYTQLNCAGVVRIDFILQGGTDDLYFLEVNTTPGQSEASLIPQQVRAAGMNLTDFYGDLVEDAFKKLKSISL